MPTPRTLLSNPNLVLLTAVFGGLVCLPVAGYSASSTWMNQNGGSWINTNNWSGNIIADGSGNTANFSTLSLPGNSLVSLDGARTIGNLTFDDLNSVKHTWTLNPGSGGLLTLAGTTPTITVGGSPTTINAVIAGTTGLTKAGAGRLVLTSTNSYTGTNTVNAGTLTLPSTSFSISSPLAIAAGASAESAGTLSFIVNSSGTTFEVTGTGTLHLTSAVNSAASPDLYFGPNHSGNSYWGARLGTSLDLGNTQRFVFGKTGHNGIGQYGLTNADCQFAGGISGSGGLTLIAQNNWTGTSPMEVGFAFNASNSFTGPIEIQRGSVYLGAAGSLSKSNVLTFSPVAGNNARLFLYGRNAQVSDLSSPGAGAAVIANGNLKTGASLTLGMVTLTVTQNNPTTFGGTITDTFSEYDGSGSGTTGPLNLVKNGPATLVLTGANTYTGSTTISAGILQIDGVMASSPITTQSGGRLSGVGQINSAVSVQNGGILAPGDNSLGALGCNNTLNLSGTAIM